jgi:hypothetical protein
MWINIISYREHAMNLPSITREMCEKIMKTLYTEIVYKYFT